MSWFSTPELPINQLIEAMYFLVFFGLFGLVLPTLDLVLGRRDSPDWTWKQDVRLAGGLTATAWFILCLVSLYPWQVRAPFRILTESHFPVPRPG
jgi:hypothetical protein